MNYKMPEIQIPPMISVSELNKKDWTIVGIEGPCKQMRFFCDRRLVLGRNAKMCNIVFPANMPGISKVHCELVPTKKGLLLRDMGSSFGTFLEDGRCINDKEAVLLKKGDCFSLADAGVIFQVR